MKRYSNKAIERILEPQNGGTKTSVPEEMRLCIGKENGLTFYIVVDESDGVIADCSFTCYGGPALVAAADIACELILRKNYIQASRLSGDALDHRLRDFGHTPAFPKEADRQLNIVVSVIEEALTNCHDITIESPVPIEEESSLHPGWNLLSKEEKLEVIKGVIATEIQPYIELDSGGIEIVSFEDEKLLTIAYQGACTTCPSSIGSTLDAINGILKNKVHPSLSVKADMSVLTFSYN